MNQYTTLWNGRNYNTEEGSNVETHHDMLSSEYDPEAK